MAGSSAIAERQLLGSLVVAPETKLAPAVQRLDPDDFADKDHRLAFQAIAADPEGGLPAWIDWMQANHRDTAHWIEQFTEYGLSVTSSALLGHRISQVSRAGAKRRLSAEFAALELESRELRATNASEMADFMSSAVQRVTDAGGELGAERDPLGLPGTWIAEELDRETAVGIPTGLADLDNCIVRGLCQGEVTIVAASPGVGKSALALQMAANCAVLDAGVFYASLEMSRQALAQRLSGASGGSPRELGRKPLTVWDPGSASLQTLRAAVEHTRQHAPVDLVVIDYMGLLQGAAGTSRYEHVSDLSRGIKILAKDLGVHVISLCQLNRMGAEGQPGMHHLRDSGQLEADADNIVLLWAAEDDVEASRLPWKLVKQREGTTGGGVFDFRRETGRIGNRSFL